MGKVCFSKILRYTCLAAIAVAAAFLAAITFANPASADPNDGGGNLDGLKSWDTDNLSRWVGYYQSVGPKNYRIPYHDYSGYSSSGSHAACRSRVADAFFQTGGDTGAVNDFHVASYGSESEAGTVAATGSRDSGFRRLKRT